jgi:hypothetical protein
VGIIVVASWEIDMFTDRRTLAIWLLVLVALATPSQAADLKPRIIVLTDISPNTVEPDDMESMIRLLAHADLFEIEGLVASTGWSNRGGQERPDLIEGAVRAYEKDLPNLRRRSAQTEHLAEELRQEIGYWPSPDYLRSRIVTGSKKMGYKFIGAENDSPGSELIIKAASETDERPVWILVWGGGNTAAQAVWRVQKDRAPEELKRFLHKIRVYTITDQDRAQRGGAFEDSAHHWLRKEFSEDLVFLWDESAWTFQNRTGRSNWEQYAAHIQGHGSLGAMYPKYKYGVEGDSPSFYYLMPNGLNDPENPSFGGWGGTFGRGTNRDGVTQSFTNHRGSVANPISRKYETRFYSAIFNNFAARMDWVKDGTGNRNPVAVIEKDGDKDNGLSKIKLTPVPGKPVALDASASHDPDGDELKFSWWVLTEAGTYTGEVTIAGADSRRATVHVPADSAGKSFHVICEVTDNGTPNLTAYRRIVLEPGGPTDHK